MVRSIPKDGKVWRLSKESWDALGPYDSDPNVAISKIMKALAEKPAPASVPAQHPGGCNFDEKRMKEIVKTGVEEGIQPYIGR